MTHFWIVTTLPYAFWFAFKLSFRCHRLLKLILNYHNVAQSHTFWLYFNFHLSTAHILIRFWIVTTLPHTLWFDFEWSPHCHILFDLILNCHHTATHFLICFWIVVSLSHIHWFTFELLTHCHTLFGGNYFKKFLSRFYCFQWLFHFDTNCSMQYEYIDH